jgi:transcriptional regulator with XRE-family HTH domain
MRAGVSVGYLSNIEAGRKQPADAVTATVARELGVSVDAITYPVDESVVVSA